MSSSTVLSSAQEAQLVKLAREEEDTRVVQWCFSAPGDGGPIIRRTHNGHARFDFAAFRRISRAGHLLPMSRTALAEAGLSARGVGL